ncbi:hypothetical protein ANANG_G00136930 [Anguilla anguilla]|uniref:Uncharacterized protein n=1 Tax=Anguilla anguilla TaxID=7936 RepID=A0A9D3RW16_ANGAN|nr:hypothetical protein ANANG_G00136930 [Anguilla anguilla]
MAEEEVLLRKWWAGKMVQDPCYLGDLLKCSLERGNQLHQLCSINCSQSWWVEACFLEPCIFHIFGQSLGVCMFQDGK